MGEEQELLACDNRFIWSGKEAAFLSGSVVYTEHDRSNSALKRWLYELLFAYSYFPVLRDLKKIGCQIIPHLLNRFKLNSVVTEINP